MSYATEQPAVVTCHARPHPTGNNAQARTPPCPFPELTPQALSAISGCASPPDKRGLGADMYTYRLRHVLARLVPVHSPATPIANLSDLPSLYTKTLRVIVACLGLCSCSWFLGTGTLVAVLSTIRDPLSTSLSTAVSFISRTSLTHPASSYLCVCLPTLPLRIALSTKAQPV